MLGRDAGARVRDRDLDRTVPATGGHRDAAPVRGEPDRVVDEVEQDLVHALAVGREGREIERDVVADLDAAPRHRDVDLGDQVVHQRLERQLLDPERDLAGLEPRELQQLIHEPSEPLDLGQHHAERRGVGFLHAVEEVLQVRADRRDRRLELVGDVGHEVAAALLEMLELSPHPIERDGEPADLVAALRVHADGVVPRLHPPSRRRHVAEGLCHPAGHLARDHERDAGGDDADQEELPPDALQETGGRGQPTEEPARRRPRERRDRAAVGRGDGGEHVGPDDSPPGGLHAETRQLSEVGAPDLRRAVRVEDHDHRVGRHRSEVARRGLPREAECIDRLGVARGVPQGERDQEVADQQRETDRDHDRRPELRSDRRETVQRARRHRHSLNAYPTPWTVRMNRGSLPSSPILRRRRATCESTTRPPA